MAVFQKQHNGRSHDHPISEPPFPVPNPIPPIQNLFRLFTNKRELDLPKYIIIPFQLCKVRRNITVNNSCLFTFYCMPGEGSINKIFMIYEFLCLNLTFSGFLCSSPS